MADLDRWQYGEFEGIERMANGGDEGNYHGPYAGNLLRSVRRRVISVSLTSTRATIKGELVQQAHTCLSLSGRAVCIDVVLGGSSIINLALNAYHS